MSRFRKVMLAAAICAASASVFVGCSDDNFPKHRMGAVGINSLLTTTTSVTAYWTMVTDGSCAGYKVVICEGTRENPGEVVITEEFDSPKKYTATFNGLQPNKHYVMTTQAIPSSTSGFNEADTYAMDFMTAPLISDIVYSAVAFARVEGDTIDTGTMSVTWSEIAKENCGGYTASLQQKTWEDKWVNIANGTVNNPATAKYEFKSVLLADSTYRVSVTPNPNNSCYYQAGTAVLGAEFTPTAE